jgi:hypothetical protein
VSNFTRRSKACKKAGFHRQESRCGKLMHVTHDKRGLHRSLTSRNPFDLYRMATGWLMTCRCFARAARRFVIMQLDRSCVCSAYIARSQFFRTRSCCVRLLFEECSLNARPMTRLPSSSAQEQVNASALELPSAAQQRNPLHAAWSLLHALLLETAHRAEKQLGTGRAASRLAARK